MAVQPMDVSEFERAAAEGDMLLVDFHAKWCGPCKMMAPVVDRLASANPTLNVRSIDVDQESELGQRYLVFSIPSLVLFQGGRVLDRLVGFPSEAGVKVWLGKALADELARH